MSVAAASDGGGDDAATPSPSPSPLPPPLPPRIPVLVHPRASILTHLLNHPPASLPLLTHVPPAPLAYLDAGVRVAPVWPRKRKQTAAASAAQLGREEKGWMMTNERARTPFFCVSPLRIVAQPAVPLHPFMFPSPAATTSSHRSNQGLFHIGKENKTVASTAWRNQVKTRSQNGIDPIVEDDAMEEEKENEDEFASSTVASRKALAASYISEFPRIMDPHRSRSAHFDLSAFLSSDPSSSSARLRAAAASLPSFYEPTEEECINYIPDELLREILDEEIHLEQQEAEEEIEDIERMEVITIQQNSGSPSASRQSWLIHASGALMDHLAVSHIPSESLLSYDTISTSAASSIPNFPLAHSIPLGSTLQQICLTTPSMSPPQLADSSVQPSSSSSLQEVLPLIVSRTTYRLYVHTLQFDASASASSTAAPSPTLLSIDHHSFSSPIVDITTNPFISNELIVLTQDASLWIYSIPELTHANLFEIQSGRQQQLSASTSKRKLTHLPRSCWLPVSRDYPVKQPLPFGRISFTSIPRTLLVVLREDRIEVDLRAPYTKMTSDSSVRTPSRGKLLPRIPMRTSNALAYSSIYLQPDPVSARKYPSGRIYGMSVCPSNRFQYILITSDYIVLRDTRVSDPLLTWLHHQTSQPPTKITWIGREKCQECTAEDRFFVTHNQASEVTLYHYAVTVIALSGANQSMLFSSNTVHSKFAPLRLQSFLNLSNSSSTTFSAASSISTSAADPVTHESQLLSLRILPSSTNGVLHLLQMSKYGTVLMQSFQHRHDDKCQITNSTVNKIVVQDSALPAPKAAPHRSPSDASSASAAPSTPPPLRNRVSITAPISAPKSALLTLPMPAPSSSTSLPRGILPHEIKPFHTINLKNLLESCAQKLVKGREEKVLTPKQERVKRRKLERNQASDEEDQRSDSPSSSRPPSFSLLLSHFLRCFNERGSTLYTFLALPKTLQEIVEMVVGTDVLDQQARKLMERAGLRKLNNEDKKKDGLKTPTRRGKSRQTATKPSASSSIISQFAPSDFHRLTHLVSTALHAFVHYYEPEQSHPPYHTESWPRNVDGNAEDDEDDDDEEQSNITPSSPAWPHPTFALSHYHLSLERFSGTTAMKKSGVGVENADDEEEKSISASHHSVAATPSLSTCICTSSSVSNACCCHSACTSPHCLRLHSTLYTVSPSVLQQPWSAVSSTTSEHLNSAASFNADGIHVSLEPYSQVSGNVAPASGSQQMDLSQDIGFLMSQTDSMMPQASQDQPTLPAVEEDEVEQGVERKLKMDAAADFDERKDGDQFGSSFMSASYPTQHLHYSQDVTLPFSVSSASASPDSPSIAPDPTAFSHLLANMSDSWQTAERIYQQYEMRKHSPANAEEEEEDLPTQEANLLQSTGAAFFNGLLAHDLAFDAAAANAATNEFGGEDMRGAMMEEMEDQAGRDDD